VVASTGPRSQGHVTLWGRLGPRGDGPGQQEREEGADREALVDGTRLAWHVEASGPITNLSLLSTRLGIPGRVGPCA
jgi:hypothetical protein